MAKYKNLQELAEAFKSGELEGWVLMLDNDSTYLRYDGPLPKGIENDTEEHYEYEEQKSEEGDKLYNGSQDIYILDQALKMAGIPNEGV
jgi:hypothetical protein